MKNSISRVVSVMKKKEILLLILGLIIGTVFIAFRYADNVYAGTRYIDENEYQYIDEKESEKYEDIKVKFKAEGQYEYAVLFVKESDSAEFVSIVYEITDNTVLLSMEDLMKHKDEKYYISGFTTVDFANIDDCKNNIEGKTWKIKSEEDMVTFIQCVSTEPTEGDDITPDEDEMDDANLIEIEADTFEVLDAPNIQKVELKKVSENEAKGIYVEDEDKLELTFQIILRHNDSNEESQTENNKLPEEYNLSIKLKNSVIELNNKNIKKIESKKNEYYDIYKCTAELTGEDFRSTEGEEISGDVVIHEDNNNNYTGELTSNLVYLPPINDRISIKSIKISNDDSNRLVVTNKEIVNIQIAVKQISEDKRLDIIADIFGVMIDGEEVCLDSGVISVDPEPELESDDGEIYTISFKIPENIKVKDGVESKDFDGDNSEFGLTIKDITGEVKDIDFNNNTLKYYKSLESAIVISSIDALREGESIDNSYVLRTQDKLRVVINTTHPIDGDKIEAKLVDIEGNVAINKVIENGKTEWIIIFDLTECSEDIEDIEYSITFNDGIQSYTNTWNSDYDFYAPIEGIKPDITSNAIVKNGDIITVSFEVSHRITVQDVKMSAAKYNDKSFSEVEIEEDENSENVKILYKYTLEFEVTGDANVNCDNEKLELKLKITDEATNMCDMSTDNIGITYYSPIKDTVIYDILINGEESDETDEENKGYVKNGDEIKIILKAGHPVTVCNGEIDGKAVIFTEKEGIWEGKITLDNDLEKDALKDDQEIGYKFTVKDAIENDDAENDDTENDDAENDDTENEQHIFSNQDGKKTITYYAAINVSDFKMSLKNKNDAKFAKEGDIITISFSTTHPILINGSEIEISIWEELNLEDYGCSKVNDKYNYVIEHEIGGGQTEDNKIIGVKLVINDKANNEEVLINNTSPTGSEESEEENVKPNANQITFYKPIGDSLVTLTFTKENKISPTYVNNENTVTVVYKTTHPVSLESVMIAGQNVSFENAKNNGCEWVGEFNIGELVKASKGVGNTLISDNQLISYKFEVSDAAQNTPVEYETKKEDSFTYYAPISYNLEMTSNNENNNTQIAREGDEITITFSTTHPVSLTGTKIGNSNITFQTTADKMIWEATYQVDRGDTLDMNAIAMAFKVNDAAGNEEVVGTESSIIPVIYYAPIKIDKFTISSKNTTNSEYAINDNKVEISFTTNHPLVEKGNYLETTDNANKRSFTIGFSNVKQAYTGTYKIINGEYSDNTFISVRLNLKDAAGNTYDLMNTGSVTYYAPINLNNSLKMISNNVNGNDIAMDGNTITVTFSTTHPLLVKESKMLITGRDPIYIQLLEEKNGVCTYKIEYKIKNGENLDYKEITKNLILKDAAGIIHNANYTGNVTYYAPINLGNSFKMISNNVNGNNIAMDGNTITVTFSTTHPLNENNSNQMQIVNKKSIDFEFQSYEKGKYIYKGTYTIEKEENDDNKKITKQLNLCDAAGNTYEDNHTGKVTYYAPIVAHDFKIQSSNEISGHTLAKNKDIITVSFYTKHPLNKRQIKIPNGRTIDINEIKQSNNQYRYEGTFEVIKGEYTDNEVIKMDIVLSDAAGNNYKKMRESGVKYFAPIVVNSLTLESNNASNDSHIAKNGDKVKLSFNTTHPVQLSNMKLGTSSVAFTTSDNMFWNAEYTVSEGDTINMNAIAMAFQVNDAAGNKQVTKTQDDLSPIIYYAPILVSDLKIVTNNAKDGNQYAKDENIVTVSFVTNHKVDVSSIRIAGKTIEEKEPQKFGDTYRYEMNYTIQNGDLDDSSTVGFEFQLEDLAKNEVVKKNERSEGVENKITYYEPITATTTFSSNYGDGTYIKNGDSVTVNCFASHNVKIINATVAGRTAETLGNDTNSPFMRYTIPNDEASIAEGDIIFEYSIEDLAGNTLSVHEVSKPSPVENIIYSRTLPKVTITRDNTNGAKYFSGKAEYTIEFTGKHLFVDGLSCMIGIKEHIGDYLKEPIDGGYKIVVELDEENAYQLKVSCTDLAGNKDVSNAGISVTIDKKNPELQIVNIQTGHVFVEGFTLADYLKINEDNLDEISCMLTDSTGTRDWNIGKPITGDGKKTVTLKMVDKAGNVSETYVYDFYVDTTAPVPVILDRTSGYLFKQGNNDKEFISNVDLKISLEPIHIGDTPDSFKSIKIVDSKGKEINVMETGTKGDDGSYTISLNKDGKYTIQIEAVDSAGNETGILEYQFYLGQKAWYIRFYNNTPVFVTSVASLAVVIVALLAIILVKKKRNEK